mmetsp:Transcript_22144/g.57759  ORF Transcript_22144/g.57759 Transcript_22144/m.57759 type:complete len:99 (-) Transcript_22144:37-333(-)
MAEFILLDKVGYKWVGGGEGWGVGTVRRVGPCRDHDTASGDFSYKREDGNAARWPIPAFHTTWVHANFWGGAAPQMHMISSLPPQTASCREEKGTVPE